MFPFFNITPTGPTPGYAAESNFQYIIKHVLKIKPSYWFFLFGLVIVKSKAIHATRLKPKIVAIVETLSVVEGCWPASLNQRDTPQDALWRSDEQSLHWACRSEIRIYTIMYFHPEQTTCPEPVEGRASKEPVIAPPLKSIGRPTHTSLENPRPPWAATHPLEPASLSKLNLH